MIVEEATAFAQNLVFTGATVSLAQFAVNLPLASIEVFITMQAVVSKMGMLMDSISTMMATLPIFMPVKYAMHFDRVWFAIVYLMNIEIGLIPPPFGMTLFAMKGVVPSNVTMGDIYWAAIPFCVLISVGSDSFGHGLPGSSPFATGTNAVARS